MIPLRDATLATLLLFGIIGAGSGGFAHLDAALFGYLAATVAAGFAIVYRTSAFWRRPPSAFYARALLRAFLHPRQLAQVLGAAGRDLAAQRFIARRSRVRWLAHLLLSGGTLVSFAITVPLVWGWLRFEAEGERTYRALLLSFPVARFAPDGLFGWLVFHALSAAAVGVLLGATFFLGMRLRARYQPGAADAFHLGPLWLLLAVAVTGLTLPVAGRWGMPTLFRATALLHEASVIALLLALPFTKLAHLFTRPLHLGAQLVAAGAPRVGCVTCGAPRAPEAQAEAVEALLAARGFHFADQARRCAVCRRRQLAAAHAELLGAHFQPQPADGRARSKGA